MTSILVGLPPDFMGQNFKNGGRWGPGVYMLVYRYIYIYI